MKTDYKRLSKTLEKLYKSKTLREDILSLIWAVNSIKRRDEVSEEFGGWEHEHITLRELLEFLGLTEKSNADSIIINKNEPLLDYKILMLEDDGMGYGANNGYCCQTDIDNENKNIRLWFL